METNGQRKSRSKEYPNISREVPKKLVKSNFQKRSLRNSWGIQRLCLITNRTSKGMAKKKLPQEIPKEILKDIPK